MILKYGKAAIKSLPWKAIHGLGGIMLDTTPPLRYNDGMKESEDPIDDLQRYSDFIESMLTRQTSEYYAALEALRTRAIDPSKGVAKIFQMLDDAWEKMTDEEKIERIRTFGGSK